MREGVFKALHDDLGHQGRDRTTSLFKQRFFWSGMDTFIEDNVRNCPRCTLRKTHSSLAPLVNIASSAPMEIVCIDFLSLERSKGGFEHIMVVTDHFTRYAQAYPTKNQTAKTTAKVLFEQFIVHYGFPSRIHSDQGANFESGLIKELCNLGGINKSHTTPYHAMGNGMTERFNQTILKCSEHWMTVRKVTGSRTLVPWYILITLPYIRALVSPHIFSCLEGSRI